MDLSADLLPAGWLWAGQLLFWPALVHAAWRSARAPGAEMPRNPHVFLGSCVAVLVLWQIKGGVPPAPPVHLLGATLLTLLFGPRLALIGMSAVLAAHTLNGAADWMSFGVNGLVSVLLPVLFTATLARGVRRHLPPNLFAYIFVAGFAGAALSIGLVGLASGALLAAASPLGAAPVLDGHLPAYLLLLFPEAFVTGMVLTLLAVFYPQWVATLPADYMRDPE